MRVLWGTEARECIVFRCAPRIVGDESTARSTYAHPRGTRGRCGCARRMARRICGASTPHVNTCVNTCHLNCCVNTHCVKAVTPICL
eukprot:6091631-Prymnesium_polylepis.1